MLNSSGLNLKSGKLLLVLMILIAGGLLLKVEQLADTKPMYTFQCAAETYEVQDENPLPFKKSTMNLKVTEDNGQLSLRYLSSVAGFNDETAEITGVLSELSVSELMYHYQLQLTDLDVSNGHLADYLRHELNIDLLTLNQSFKQDIQVLEMDLAQNYLIIKFLPNNTLWACDLV
ncbi:hypothetical protein [Shewanella gaetbuli]|uniref:Uncharacterized protein n=1 Tax=Shewanella gaetbuli TaxID=220752 RepID=A0A9X2CK52_9GAMM|nr:hypothetical protein [Shewanella gaetbuli]MCL1141274.1 hypothetical protein [Shewanella gaetbuli]